MDSKLIEKYFDNLAEKYHQERISSKKLFNESIEIPATLSLAKKYKSKKVLDVGCGSGIISKVLSIDLAMQVVAIDVSTKMLEIASDYCKDTSVKFEKCGFHEHSPSEKYDLILGSFFLGYEDDLVRTFRKTKSLLKNQGGAIFSMVHPVRMSMDRHDYKSYEISNYFSRDNHKVIIVPNEEPLLQPKRTFEQVIDAAESAGITLRKLLEPRPVYELGDKRRFDLYSMLPTVVVFEFVINGDESND